MKKTLAYCLCYLVYPFSFLFPRRKKKWAFGSFRGAFNDNSKYLFINVSECRPEISVAWISNNRDTVRAVRGKGLRAYYTYSLRGAFWSLTSKYWFVNAYCSDIMYCFSGGATVMNLWHGVGGFKKAEFCITKGTLAKRYVDKEFKEVFFHPESFKRPDYVLSSAPFQSGIFSPMFRVPLEKCLEYGYPRDEILIWDDEKRLEFVRKYESEHTMKVIESIAPYEKTFVYMPTWRDSQREVFTQGMDLQVLNRLFAEKNYMLLLKPHANTIIDNDAMSSYSNVLLLDGTIDVYPILPYTHCIITDYSSVFYDYIRMEGKDAILYVYDFEDFVKDRELLYPYDENIAGRKVYSFDELKKVIVTSDYQMDENDRVRLLERYWGKSSPKSPSERITEFFTDGIKDPAAPSSRYI